MANKPVAERRLPKWVVGLLSTLLAFAVFVGGLYAFYAYAYQGKIFPNTLVGTVQVEGLDNATARDRVTEVVRQFEAEPLELVVAGTAVTLPSADISLSYDVEASVQAAYERGRSGSIWRQFADQAQAVVTPIEVPLVYTYDETALTAYVDGLSKRFDHPEANAGVDFEKGKLVVTDPKGGERFNRELLTQFITGSIATATRPVAVPEFPLRPVTPTVGREQVEAILPTITAVVSTPLTLQFESKSYAVDPEQLTAWITIEDAGAPTTAPKTEDFFEPSSGASVSFDAEEIAGYLKTLATELNQEAVDAKLTIRDGKATVFQTSQDGRKLDEEKTAEAITKALRDRRSSARAGQPVAKDPVKLVVSVTKPTVSSSTVDDLGIKELIGTATTDFSGSPDNRIHNIKTGTKFMNGWLIKPGEEFSTVKALGEVDASTGYLPELVIKENRTIPEYGGGLCQVSTTLFRSVLNAGLPVTERRNHSYRVSYYEKDGNGRNIGPGLDATVYLPKPDFKFKNDTPGWILVQGQVTGLKVTFEIYGTSDGRKSVVDGPHTLSTTPAPAPVYEQSNSLAPGETKQIEKPHEGASTVATYTVTRGGEVINKQTFESKYKALPARYLKGPDAPAAEPAPEAAPTETSESPSA